MRRQLYRGGGIADLYPRQKYRLGSKWQDFKDSAVDTFQKIVPKSKLKSEGPILEIWGSGNRKNSRQTSTD